MFDRSQRPECLTCPAFAQGVYVPPEIRAGARLLLVAERPGETESKTGIILSGRSGKLTDQLLAKVGLEREAVSLANTCCCYLPGNPTPTAPEIAACAGLLELAIEQARPEVTVALGGTATARLMGERAISKWQGSIVTTPSEVMVGETRVLGPDVFKFGKKKGEPRPHLVETTLTQPEGRKVVLTFHPAALLDSGLAEWPLVVSALRRAKDLADRKPLVEVGEAIVAWPQSPEVAALLLSTHKEIVLDVETDGANGPLTLVGLAPSHDYAVTFAPSPELLDVLRKAFAEPGRTVVGHNVSYDVKTMAREGVDMHAVRLWDTMHAAFLERPDLPEVIRPKALENVASRLRGVRYYNWKEAFRSGSNPSPYWYCASDCAWTAAIRDEMRVRLAATGRLDHFERDLMRTLWVLIDIEQDGVRIDRSKLDELRECQQKVVDELQAAWVFETGLQPEDRASTPKMRAYFYDKLGLPRQYKGRGRKRIETLDEAACETLLKKFPEVEALRLLVSLRHVEKIMSTYLALDLDERGHWHPDYNLSGAVTGRLSGNAQQIPRTSDKCESRVEDCVCGEVRSVFIADEGDECLAVADYKQIEFRLWGVLAGDKHLLDLYDNGVEDVHAWAATKLGVPRKVAKHMTHASMFGAGAAKVAAFTGVDVQTAQRFIDAITGEFPVTAQYKGHLVQEARARGYITNPFSRRIYFRVSEGKVKETEVYASAPQSTAAEMIGIAAYRAAAAGLKVRSIIHDELSVSCRTAGEARLLQEAMEAPFEELRGWACPCDLGTGPNWALAKETH